MTEKRPDILIAIMGATGTGKSSLINLITGHKSVLVGHNLESATTDVKEIHCFESDGRCVTLVDTPGFDDNRDGMTDTVILEKISEFLSQNYDSVEKKSKLNGIIYLHRITDVRMGGVSARNTRMMQKLCGDGSLKNVVILTTRWDELGKDESVGVQREKDLKSNPEFFGKLVDKGAQFHRHNNTRGSALDVVGQMLDYKSVTLQLQKEIAEGAKLEDTTAGSSLTEHFKSLIEDHKTAMDNIRREHEEAMAKKDEEWKKELELERSKLNSKIREIEEGRRGLEKRVELSEKVLEASRNRIEQMRLDALAQQAKIDNIRLEMGNSDTSYEGAVKKVEIQQETQEKSPSREKVMIEEVRKELEGRLAISQADAEEAKSRNEELEKKILSQQAAMEEMEKKVASFAKAAKGGEELQEKQKVERESNKARDKHENRRVIEYANKGSKIRFLPSFVGFPTGAVVGAVMDKYKKKPLAKLES